MMLAIDELAKQIHKDNVKKGFWEDRDDSYPHKATMIALMHSELSEALEAVRKDLNDSHLPQFKGDVVEMADTMIRILDYCAGFDLPLGEAMKAKLEYNRSRPHKHGKKF